MNGQQAATEDYPSTLPFCLLIYPYSLGLAWYILQVSLGLRETAQKEGFEKLTAHDSLDIR
jgi:hypothetical protein